MHDGSRVITRSMMVEVTSVMVTGAANAVPSTHTPPSSVIVTTIGSPDGALDDEPERVVRVGEGLLADQAGDEAGELHRHLVASATDEREGVDGAGSLRSSASTPTIVRSSSSTSSPS